MKRALLIACFVAAAVPAHAQFTAFMSPDEERKVGAQEHVNALAENGGVYTEKGLDEYVVQIGYTMVPNVETPQPEWRFTLLNTPLVNAFALPGGYVYITRGIMAIANNEAELAGVLGHEMGHVTARHSAQRYSKAVATQIGAGLAGVLGSLLLGTSAVGDIVSQGGALYLQKGSREQEDEADGLGLKTIARTGYAPQAMPAFLQTLNDDTALTMKMLGRPGGELEFNMIQTHPRTVDRVERTMTELGAVQGGQIYRRDAYLDRIDGMLYGDTPDQGFIRGRTFSHPDLKIGFTAPQGFYLMNGAAALTGTRPDGVRMVFDSAVDKRYARTAPLDYLTRVWAQNAQLQDVQNITINGMPAATGRAAVKASSGQMVARLVAISTGDAIYRFMFVVPPRIASQVEPDLIRAVHTFHRLSAQELAQLHPLRLRVLPVRQGDTEESFARRMPYDDFQLDRFRTLNGLRPGEGIAPGQRVKIVE